MVQKLFYLGNIYDDTVIKVIKLQKENDYTYIPAFNNN
jgi:hypothetical protein